VKRYPVVIGATVAGLASVLSFHSHAATLSSAGGPGRSATGRSTPPASSGTSSQGPPPARGGQPKGATSTVTGSLEQYGYGQLSIRVTMSGGKITRLAVATLKTADTYSQQLAGYVIPVLQREILSAQSARVSGVTGATYTSEAYAYSVQSALDKLKK
jgi:uncharacterized protein with FMN-binding domain